MNPKDVNQQNANSFLCHLLLPYIESYWLTLTYLTCIETKHQVILESDLYGKVQWLGETLYDDG